MVVEVWVYCGEKLRYQEYRVTVCVLSESKHTAPALQSLVFGAGTDIQNYGSHFIELERLVTEAQSAGCVCTVGDFNAHIGLKDGVSSKINREGLLIQQWEDMCALYAASLSPTSSCTMYTYFKSDIVTAEY